MSTSKDSLKERLIRENEEYRTLLEKHRDFEKQLDKLNSRNYLSDDEKVEATKLKKQKLVLKDRMAEIARKFGRNVPDLVSN